MEDCYYIILIIVLVILIILKNKNNYENFDGVTSVGNIDDNGIFVPLFDNNGNKLNVTLISKPFGSNEDYKLYLINKPNKIYLGITSYMEFPYMPSNPEDNYVNITEKQDNDNKTEHYFDMYLDICDGWLHCFKNPSIYLPVEKPMALISESDFVNYNIAKPDLSIKKEYDYIYSCPKVNEDSTCDDWVSYNKNWSLAKKCIFKMSDMGLRGLLVGREHCEVPKNCDTTGWVDYFEMLKLYNKAKFVFVPNVVDASPRVLTECLSTNLACLVNENILGGWKYVNNKTGEFFTNENDIIPAVKKLMNNIKLNKYEPREYIIKKYGPINSGRRLKKFIFDNFKDKVNLKEKDVDYITMRGHLKDFKP